MNEAIQINVNHEVLRWARESLALNRAKAAENTGISVKRLEQLEEGNKQPSFDELKAMAKAYKRTIAALLLQVPPKEKPLPPDRRTVDSKGLGKFHERTIMAVRKARALAESLIELKQNAGISIKRFQHRASIQDSSERFAKQFRADLNIDEIRQLENHNDALDAYIDKIESLGVAVFQLSLTQDNLRGFSIVDEAIPIIGVKRGGESATAKIFTLFHELGHIILNEGGLCDLSESTTQQVEQWCNSFAAEILIPATELLKLDIVVDHKTRGETVWSKNDLITIGNYFHAGHLAILRSLLVNDLTTQAYYQEKHVAWNKPSFGRAKIPEGRNIPKETIKEKGRTYLRLAFQAFDLNKIDLKDLSDFLGVRLSYIPKTRQLLNA